MSFRDHWNRFTWSVTGNPAKFSNEHRFFNAVLFGSSLIALYGSVFNIIMGFKIILVISTLLANLFAIFIYCLSRFLKKHTLSRWLFSFFVPFLLSPIWFHNGGTQGPIIFIYFVYFSFILLEWEGKIRNILLVIMSINLTVLFLIEYFFPQFVNTYKTEAIRMTDVFFGIILYFGLAGFVIIYSKRNYIRERQKAERSDKLKSAFLANMSHEIRTPMNSIIGFSKLMQRDLTVEKRNNYIQIIDENGKYLLKLIDDIIDISRIEADNVKIKKNSCNIYKLFRKLESSFTQVIMTYEKPGLAISFGYVKPEYTIETDTVRLEQIFSNLIMNAIKFTEKGSINVGMETAGDFLRFYVSDTGIGIKEEYINAVFDRFYKLEDDSLKLIQRGTGIGLFISKKLTELMGGMMWVESTYGHGSVFWFTLPKKEIHYRSTPEYKQIVNLDTLDWSKKTLLIAEDEDANYILLEELFAPTKINLHRAKNGMEAIDLCSRNHYDLVLMDIKMPVMDGYSATNNIKSLFPFMPVIALTALAMEGDRERCLSAGCNDYIAKPVDEELLLLKMSMMFG